MQPHCVWDVGALLGEGPLWDPVARALWFVDIKRGNLHRFDDRDGGSSFAIGGSPSFVVRARAGGLLIGNRNALVRFGEGRVGDTIARIEMRDRNRTNDATVDPSGRLWFGTMDDDERHPHGLFYCFDGALHPMGGASTITNGPAISPCGRWLYYVDTLGGRIWRVAIDGSVAPFTAPEEFVSIDPADGKPDGVATDSEGCLWVALWGGWGLRRYAPDGRLTTTVTLPCANVTKVTFGGADLSTAYVTTACVGLGDAERREQPLAGGLFSFRAPAPGLPAYEVAI